jgi:hypothetical protein
VRQRGLTTPLRFVDYIESAYGVRDDGDEVLRLRARPDGSKLDQYDKVAVMFDTSIDAPTITALPYFTDVHGLLNEIHQTISNELVPQFERFFMCAGPGF